MCDKIMSTLHHDVFHLYRRARQVQINNLVIQSYCVTVVLVLCFIKQIIIINYSNSHVPSD